MASIQRWWVQNSLQNSSAGLIRVMQAEILSASIPMTCCLVSWELVVSLANYGNFYGCPCRKDHLNSGWIELAKYGSFPSCQLLIVLHLPLSFMSLYICSMPLDAATPLACLYSLMSNKPFWERTQMVLQ